MERLDVRGHLRVLFAGDSIMAGINDTGGLRLPILLALQALGLPARTVGEIDDGSGSHRAMFDLCAGNTQHQSVGGLTTAQLTAGGTYGGKTISPIATAISNLSPDIVFLALGSNDGGTESERAEGFLALYSAIARAQARTAMVHIPPFASNNTGNDFFTLDTNRETTARAARNAMAAVTEDGIPGAVIDAHMHLAASVRRPGAAFNSSTALANAVFIDSAHLHPEGAAPIACAAVSLALGVGCNVVRDALAQMPPFAPVEWKAAGNATSAGAQTLVASGPRKHRLLHLRLLNKGASAVTISIQTLKNPGAVATTLHSLVVPPNGTETLSYGLTAPLAWVNEGWRLDLAGSGFDLDFSAWGASVW